MSATSISVDILIGELLADEELCQSFFMDPEATLLGAESWGLPLSESELLSLRGPSYRLWDRVAEAVEARTYRLS